MNPVILHRNAAAGLSDYVDGPTLWHGWLDFKQSIWYATDDKWCKLQDYNTRCEHTRSYVSVPAYYTHFWPICLSSLFLSIWVSWSSATSEDKKLAKFEYLLLNIDPFLWVLFFSVWVFQTYSCVQWHNVSVQSTVNHWTWQEWVKAPRMWTPYLKTLGQLTLDPCSRLCGHPQLHQVCVWPSAANRLQQ